MQSWVRKSSDKVTVVKLVGELIAVIIVPDGNVAPEFKVVPTISFDASKYNGAVLLQVISFVPEPALQPVRFKHQLY